MHREARPIGNEMYGYVRVSTREQNEDRQLIAMQELCVPERNIFVDFKGLQSHTESF